MIRRIPLLLLMAVLMGASTCAKGVRLDSSANAAEMNDVTVIIRIESGGCSQDAAVGHGYCRKREGDPTAGDWLVLYAPPTKCKSNVSCATFQVFYPDGSPIHSVDVPADSTSVKIPWAELTHGAAYTTGHRGFWGITLRWKFLDTDGNERSGYAEGEVRMRVIGRDYIPLDNGRDDPAYAWDWSADGQRMKMTTAGRAYAGPK